MADLGAVGQDGGNAHDYIQVMAISINVVPTDKTVSGIVYDDASVAAARVVRVYRRSDGSLVGQVTSDAGTGAYSIACPNEEVQRIVLDDAGGTLYNDIIDRVIPA
jgi:hypothetical protein